MFLLFAAVAWGQTCQRQYGGVCVPSSSSSSEPACCSPDLQCLRHASSCTGDNVEVFRCAKRGGSVDVTFLCLLCFSSFSFFVFFFFFCFCFFCFFFFFFCFCFFCFFVFFCPFTCLENVLLRLYCAACVCGDHFSFSLASFFFSSLLSLQTTTVDLQFISISDFHGALTPNGQV